MKKNKKGQIMQIALFMAIVVVIACSVILMRYVVGQFYDTMEEGGMTTVAMNESRVTVESQFMVFDYSLIFLVVALIIGLIISSYLIPTHPIFLAINILGIFILVIMGMIMTNTYAEFVSGEGASTFGDTADKMPMTNYLISYLPYFAAIVLALVSIIQFARGIS